MYTSLFLRSTTVNTTLHITCTYLLSGYSRLVLLLMTSTSIGTVIPIPITVPVMTETATKTPVTITPTLEALGAGVTTVETGPRLNT